MIAPSLNRFDFQRKEIPTTSAHRKWCRSSKHSRGGKYFTSLSEQRVGANRSGRPIAGAIQSHSDRWDVASGERNLREYAGTASNETSAVGDIENEHVRDPNTADRRLSQHTRDGGRGTFDSRKRWPISRRAGAPVGHTVSLSNRQWCGRASVERVSDKEQSIQ